MTPLVGRAQEREVLRAALTSDQAELVTVYGRRRVGKTFLIRQVFDTRAFELVGIHRASLQTQLANFSRVLSEATSAAAPLTPPADWYEAFAQLRAFLEPLLRRRSSKQVVFFDEVPWLAGRRSGFLAAFEHFWNSWAGTQPKLVVVLCGSAASWMLEHIVSQRGGLHHRVTRRLRVEPFTLAEAEALLSARRIELGRYQTIELYLALGGIPHYLSLVEPGRSAAQTIDRLCCAPNGVLYDEFSNLLASLFEQSERHHAVVRALASRRRGLSRGRLLGLAGLDSGGAASRVLEELEASGFIMQLPQLGKTRRDGTFFLADEFSLFQLTWRSGRASTAGSWLSRQGSQAWRAWAGLAFEMLCLKHVFAIKRALGIDGVSTTTASWTERPGARAEDGAQIDLVIDRADRSINLCEMKFSEGPFTIDKASAKALRHKRETFRTVTGTRKTLFLTMVTTFGITRNEYGNELISNDLTMDSLFVPR